MNDHEVVLASKTGAVITQISGATSVVFGLSLNEWGVIVGLIGVVLGLVMQWYFGSQKLKLQRELYAKIQHPDQDPDTGKGEL